MIQIIKDLFKREWDKTYPDPMVVCRHATKCAHVDGYLCKPKTCEELSFTDEEWKGEGDDE